MGSAPAVERFSTLWDRLFSVPPPLLPSGCRVPPRLGRPPSFWRESSRPGTIAGRRSRVRRNSRYRDDREARTVCHAWRHVVAVRSRGGGQHVGAWAHPHHNADKPADSWPLRSCSSCSRVLGGVGHYDPTGHLADAIMRVLASTHDLLWRFHRVGKAPIASAFGVRCRTGESAGTCAPSPWRRLRRETGQSPQHGPLGLQQGTRSRGAGLGAVRSSRA